MSTAEEDVADAVYGEVNDECDGGDSDAEEEEERTAVMEERHVGLDRDWGGTFNLGRLGGGLNFG
jgi:hypothetical protein